MVMSNQVTLTGLQTGPQSFWFYSDISVTFANHECNPIGFNNFYVFVLYSQSNTRDFISLVEAHGNVVLISLTLSHPFVINKLGESV